MYISATMKSVIILLLITPMSIASMAQNDSLKTINARNTIFLELLGSGFFYSFNYERVLPGGLTLRAGAGYSGNNNGFLSEIWTVPVSGAYLISTKRDIYIELGAATTFVWEHDQKQQVFPGPVIGLRKQDLTNGGAFARIAFTPIFEIEESPRMYPYGGFSFGASF